MTSVSDSDLVSLSDHAEKLLELYRTGDVSVPLSVEVAFLYDLVGDWAAPDPQGVGILKTLSALAEQFGWKVNYNSSSKHWGHRALAYLNHEVAPLGYCFGLVDGMLILQSARWWALCRTPKLGVIAA